MRRLTHAVLGGFLVAVTAANVYAAALTSSMSAGDTLHVTCATKLTGTIGATAADLTCAAVAVLSGDWHAPTDHEHGVQPPSWVTDAGYTVSFNHPANTPNENAFPYKHSAFKDTLLTDDGSQVFVVNHLDFNPAGHASRFHSFQFWVRDPSGGVTHLSGWLDFGTGSNTGPQTRRNCDDTSVRPIMAFNARSCNALVSFESWYSAAGGFQNQGGLFPDFGFNDNPNYYDEVPQAANPTDPATWDSTGYVRNLTRRMEVAYYADRDSRRGDFYTTQFGKAVSGPTDPVCGTSFTVGTKSYTVLCLKQHVATTVRSVSFPGNSIQQTYPGGGTVQLPN